LDGVLVGARGADSGAGCGLEAFGDKPDARDSSQSAIGSAASADHAETRSLMPNIVAVVAATSSGAPMIASTGRIRGTRRDWYIREPSNRAFTAGIRPCPRRDVPSYKATSARQWSSTRAVSTSPEMFTAMSRTRSPRASAVVLNRVEVCSVIGIVRCRLVKLRCTVASPSQKHS
jgi:hypothetical protein